MEERTIKTLSGRCDIDCQFVKNPDGEWEFEKVVDVVVKVPGEKRDIFLSLIEPGTVRGDSHLIEEAAIVAERE